jgi:hypothetical protein
MNKDANMLLMGLLGVKIMRLIFCFTALYMAKNYTSQVYMDKVLIKDENPPRLTNMIYLGMVFEIIFMMMFLGLLYMADSQFKMGLSPSSFFSGFAIPDYFICTFFILAYGYIIAGEMYSKKYFLYKEDGLRAIRALSGIMFSITIVTTLCHWWIIKLL